SRSADLLVRAAAPQRLHQSGDVLSHPVGVIEVLLAVLVRVDGAAIRLNRELGQDSHHMKRIGRGHGAVAVHITRGWPDVELADLGGATAAGQLDTELYSPGVAQQVGRDDDVDFGAALDRRWDG